MMVNGHCPVADPGFPRVEGANPPRGGGRRGPTYDFAKFSQKFHEIERILTPGRGRASLTPPYRSANVIGTLVQNFKKKIKGCCSSGKCIFLPISALVRCQ